MDGKDVRDIDREVVMERQLLTVTYEHILYMRDLCWHDFGCKGDSYSKSERDYCRHSIVHFKIWNSKYRI